MRITAPISRVEELLPLSEAGADEFYCSILPAAWLEKFNSSAISRRPFGNLSDEDQLQTAIKTAHSLSAKLYLVINAQQYTQLQVGELLTLAAVFDSLNGDAIIVSDAALLAELHNAGHDYALHLSSIAGCRNVESARFFAELGASRVILPRDMTMVEIALICRKVPEVEFEAFILNDGCAFEEGSCHSIHLPPALGGPICADTYLDQYYRIDGHALGSGEVGELKELDAHYQRWLWYRFSCGFSVSQQGFPYGPCGLCAIGVLDKAGLAAVKIAGRDYPSERKLKSVQLVRRILDEYAARGDESARNLAISARGEPHHCTSGDMCYYPEVVSDKPDAIQSTFNRTSQD